MVGRRLFRKSKNRLKKKAERFFSGDETGVQNESNYIKGYAPKGQTPVLKTKSYKMRINMISAITNRGKLRFMCYEENMNQQKFIVFIKRLCKDSDGKTFLILDNLKIHHGKMIVEYAEKNKDKIEIFYLPSYTPERNPDEYLNGNLKREIAKRGHSKNLKDLRSNTNSIMRKIQKDRNHVKSYFENEFIGYAS
jgi:transposase